MLRTNLATRPFYNARAVQVLLGALGVVVLALTVFNAVQIIRLWSQERTLGAQASRAEAEEARLRREAAAIRGRIDPRELGIVAGEARAANAIIDQRTFSWTALFAEFEQTLPPDVRITAVQPRLGDDGTFIVGMTVEARQAEDLDAFIEALEMRGAFRDVRPNETQSIDDGLLAAVIEGVYIATARDAAPAAAAGNGQ